jgi:hypothetical protein
MVQPRESQIVNTIAITNCEMDMTRVFRFTVSVSSTNPWKPNFSASWSRATTLRMG